MDQNAAIEKQVFLRIAATLLALAVLADRAAGCSLPVRCLVLWLLRRAETAARAFAAEAGCLALPFILFECPGSGDSAGDATRLAGELHALAAAFHALAHRAPRWSGAIRQPNFGARLGGHPNAARRHRFVAALLPRYADTS